MAKRQTHPPVHVYPGPSLPTPNHIRLVSLQPGSDETIICELVTSELDSAPSYEALSYTWGDPLSRKVIYMKPCGSVERKEFSVTTNCFCALRRLRYNDRPRTLWIDALAIDQSNVNERNCQVGLMSKIYSQAAAVVIYLGEATNDSDLATNFIAECDSPAAETTALSYPKSEPLIRALSSYFHRPWFTRVWVIQEALLSNSGIVYCGGSTFSWSAIKNFNDFNTNTKWLAQLPFVASTSLKSLTKGNLESSLLGALLNSRHCGATDPRDKVYSLLPLLHSLDGELGLIPRYEDTPAKVYTDCAVALMADSGFEVLYAVQGGAGIERLPSWAPDWSVPPRRKVLGTVLRIMMSSFWSYKKQTGVPPEPQVLAGEAINPGKKNPIPMLGIYGYRCGKIARVGSTYLAGVTRSPLREWKALLSDDTVARVHGADNVQLSGGPSASLSDIFYDVIGAAGFSYGNAFEKFLNAQKRASRGPANVSGGSSRGHQARSWDSTVREMALGGTSESPSGDYTLPFRDIPFHEAGRGQCPSHMKYVQAVLQSCHSRRFFITDTGYIGIGPSEVEVGDDVYMCVGAAIPFALREVQSKSHQRGTKELLLVGESYMENKAWDDLEDKTYEPEYFHLV